MALTLTLLSTLAACGAPDPSARWAEPAGAGGGAGLPAGQPAAASGAPSSAAPSATPSSTPSGAPTKQPTTPPAPPPPSPGGPPPGDDWTARIPKFPPAPPAVPVALPGGDRAAWFSRIPTDQPVAFITIDDGWTKRPEALQLLRMAGVPVTLFLTINAIRDNPAFFRQLEGAGATVQAHTITHNKLRGQSLAYQKNEICGSADQLGQLYGKRPTLFRPPFGEKDDTTLLAAHACGIKAAFFWKETVDKGIVRYQTGNSIQRGDIILMHFRDRFADDFIAALLAISAAGLTPALLDDYIP